MLYRRVYEMLEDELLSCYRYVEPSPGNLDTYSLQFYRLHQDICRQIDSFFKFLLKEYDLWPKNEKQVSFDDYFVYKERLGLGSVDVDLKIRELKLWPFKEWKEGQAPEWWSLHNKLKHEFAGHYKRANLMVVWESLAAFYILLNHQRVRAMGPMGTKVFRPKW